MKWVLIMMLLSKGGDIETYDFNTQSACEEAAAAFVSGNKLFRAAFCIADTKN